MKKLCAVVVTGIVIAAYGQGVTTAEQKETLHADYIVPTTRPAVKIDTTATRKDGSPNPNFGKPQERFLSKHKEFIRRGKLPMNVLFIGDSITEGWSHAGKYGDGGGRPVWDANFAGEPYCGANFGIGGDRLQHVLWRIENGELDGIAPRIIVLLIGTNNTAHNTADEIAAGVEKIVRTLHGKLPAAKVIVLNLLPRADSPQDERRIKLQEVNEKLAAFDDGKNIFFLKLWDEFLNADGTLKRTELMPDALHPNAAGHEVMAKTIKAKIDALLK